MINYKKMSEIRYPTSCLGMTLFTFRFYCVLLTLIFGCFAINDIGKGIGYFLMNNDTSILISGLSGSVIKGTLLSYLSVYILSMIIDRLP